MPTADSSAATIDSENSEASGASWLESNVGHGLIGDQLCQVKGSVPTRIRNEIASLSDSNAAKIEDAQKLITSVSSTDAAMIGSTSSVAVNGMIAESLLCAKMCESASMDLQAETEEHTNPGSRAHPHLCSRPCMYFATGDCANGGGCNFCHRHLHPRKPHFDKRNRILLAKMSKTEIINATLPILKEKAQLGGFYDRATRLFVILYHLREHDKEAPQSINSKTFMQKTFMKTLDSMSFNTVLMQLRQKLDDSDAEQISQEMEALRKSF